MSVTVCVPVWNNTAFLIKAVDSVYDQTFDAAEIIVIDDGSDDAGAVPTLLGKVKRDAGLRYIRTTHRGPQNAWNTGLMNAEGDWFLPLASDDWLEPDFLEQALAAVGDYAQVAVCAMQEHGGGGSFYEPHPVTLEEQIQANCFPYCGLFQIRASRDGRLGREARHLPRLGSLDRDRPTQPRPRSRAEGHRELQDS